MPKELFWDICAGICVQGDAAQAVLRKDGESISFREYGKKGTEAKEMAAWLSSYGCQAVAAHGDPAFLEELVSALEEALIVPVVANEHLVEAEDAESIARLLSEGALNPPLSEDIHRCAKELAKFRRKAVVSKQSWANDADEFLEGQGIRLAEFFPDVSIEAARSLIELAMSNSAFTMGDVAKLCPPELAQSRDGIFRALKKPISKTAMACVTGALRGMESAERMIEFSNNELRKIIPEYAKAARELIMVA
jgi:hypothetical protein